MEQINQIKDYFQLIMAVILTITSIILLIKLFIKKVDKNGNGKIEKNEITDADLQFCKELLKESIKTIAIGLYQQSGMTSKQINNLMYDEIKKSKNLIEETIKKEQKENEKK